MKPASFDYHRADSTAAAMALLAGEDARPLAGGQSLGPAMNLRLARPGSLIDLAGIPELRRVGVNDDMISIGAGFTHAEIEDGVVEDPTRGLLRHVARGIAYRAIRNRGTLGGSLAHADPAADWLSTMATLGAVIVVQRANGTTARYAGDDFCRGAFTTRLEPGDLLMAVEVPKLSAEARWGYYKICRKTGEFATAIGVAIEDPTRGISRVLAGAVDGPPMLLPGLATAQIDTAAIAAAIADRLPHLDLARQKIHAVAVRRALEMLAA